MTDKSWIRRVYRLLGTGKQHVLHIINDEHSHIGDEFVLDHVDYYDSIIIHKPELANEAFLDILSDMLKTGGILAIRSPTTEQTDFIQSDKVGYYFEKEDRKPQHKSKTVCFRKYPRRSLIMRRGRKCRCMLNDNIHEAFRARSHRDTKYPLYVVPFDNKELVLQISGLPEIIDYDAVVDMPNVKLMIDKERTIRLNHDNIIGGKDLKAFYPTYYTESVIKDFNIESVSEPRGPEFWHDLISTSNPDTHSYVLTDIEQMIPRPRNMSLAFKLLYHDYNAIMALPVVYDVLIFALYQFTKLQGKKADDTEDSVGMMKQFEQMYKLSPEKMRSCYEHSGESPPADRDEVMKKMSAGNRKYIEYWYTFNDLFARNMKYVRHENNALCMRPKPRPGYLASMADSYVTILKYERSLESTPRWIKGSEVHLNKHLSRVTKGKFSLGRFDTQVPYDLAIFRLTPNDYHAFHAPMDFRVVGVDLGDYVDATVKGSPSPNLLSVNVEAIDTDQPWLNALLINNRVTLICETTSGRNKYTFYIIVVAATLVAKIRFYLYDGNGLRSKSISVSEYARTVSEKVKEKPPNAPVYYSGELLGSFEIGASTVILVTPHIAEKDADVSAVAYLDYINHHIEIGGNVTETFMVVRQAFAKLRIGTNFGQPRKKFMPLGLNEI